MAIIKPFKRLRPRVDVAHQVAILPVDSMDKQKIKYIVENNEHCFLQITNPELYHQDVELTESGKRILNKKSQEKLNSMLESEILVKDEEPMLFVYKQIIGERELTGIVACTSVDDYVNSYIKKHEFTRSEKEKDISYHIDCCNANTGTIYLIYKWEEKIQNIIDETMKNTPEYEFTTEDGIIHLVWPIAEENRIEELVKLFEKVDNFYIADGHHRTAAAARVCAEKRKNNPNYTGEEEYNFFLSVLFPDKDLSVIDYNRVVTDLNGYTNEEFLNKVSENFIIEKVESKEPFKPAEAHTIGMYLDGAWYKLIAKACSYDNSHPVKCLDVAVLQDFLLDPVLGIKDPRTDKRIDFVAGILGLEELERRVNTDMKVAFSLFPCSIKELMDVADIGEVMPPKSTWFEPKLRSGLFIHSLD
ncbi:MAG: DUF1015 domain-containing protein [Solirubrobacterales bacterium]